LKDRALSTQAQRAQRYAKYSNILGILLDFRAIMLDFRGIMSDSSGLVPYPRFSRPVFHQMMLQFLQDFFKSFRYIWQQMSYGLAFLRGIMPG
jgi:hypothetical protein